MIDFVRPFLFKNNRNSIGIRNIEAIPLLVPYIIYRLINLTYLKPAEPMLLAYYKARIFSSADMLRVKASISIPQSNVIKSHS